MNKDDIIKALSNQKQASVKDTPEAMEQRRREIAEQTKAFLESGGEIKQIPIGVITAAKKVFSI